MGAADAINNSTTTPAFSQWFTFCGGVELESFNSGRLDIDAHALSP